MAAEEDDGAVEAELTQQRLAIARRHRKRERYASQHNKDPAWFRHSKHVVVLSFSGRPVFTRYGDSGSLAGWTGVVSAIIHNFERHGDVVQSIRAGPYTLAFLLKGPLYLMAVSRTPETQRQLLSQLEYVHRAIMSTLTAGINQALEARPGYDVRGLLGGTENLLNDLIADSGRSPAFLLDAVSSLRLAKPLRLKVGAVLRKARTKNTLYALLLSGTQVVQLAQNEKCALKTSDILLLINTFTNSESTRTKHSWLPICLPGFNDAGFLYAYVTFLSGDLCLGMVSSSSDDFEQLHAAKARVREGLEQGGLMAKLRQARANRHLHVDEVGAAVPEMRHFLYKSAAAQQFVMPLPAPPYDTQVPALFRRYQHVHARLLGGRTPHQLYYEVGDFCTVLGWRTPEFELLVAYTPLVTKERVTTAANRILRFIRKEEEALFAGMSPANW